MRESTTLRFLEFCSFFHWFFGLWSRIGFSPSISIAGSLFRFRFLLLFSIRLLPFMHMDPSLSEPHIVQAGQDFSRIMTVFEIEGFGFLLFGLLAERYIASESIAVSTLNRFLRHTDSVYLSMFL